MDIQTLLKSNSSVYSTRFEEKNLVFHYRLLTLKEYKVFKNLRDQGVLSLFDLHDEVFNLCYLGNIDFLSEDTPAGVSYTIGGMIMHLSGDCENDKAAIAATLYAHRASNPSGNLNSYMKAIILRAFPSYKYEELQNLNRDSLYEAFVLSENILMMNNKEYTPLDIEKHLSFGEKRKQNAKPIDFERENSALKKATGPFSELDAQESTKLTQQQLQKLSSAHRR